MRDWFSNRLLLTMIGLVWVVFAFGQTTYTVSNTDGGADYSSLSALQTALSGFSSGDTVKFRGNDTLTGTLDITSSPGIYFTRYGTGADPVISGASTATTWTNTSGDLWRFDMGSTIDVRFLTINGEIKALGRYPNTTYLDVDGDDTDNSDTEILDNDLTQATGYWNNSEVVCRTVSWNVSTVQVDNWNATTNYLTLAQSMTYGPNLWGDVSYYFLQNDTVVLDLEGEWCTSGQYLYLYTTGDPNDSVITYSSETGDLIDVTSDNITFDSIHFTMSNGDGIDRDGADNFTMTNCKIDYVRTGIDSEQSSDFTFTDNTVNYTGIDGLNLGYDSISYIANNAITRINHIPGMFIEHDASQIGYGIYSAIEWTDAWHGGHDMLIEKNFFDYIGYSGIRATYADSVVVRNNKFLHNC